MAYRLPKEVLEQIAQLASEGETRLAHYADVLDGFGAAPPIKPREIHAALGGDDAAQNALRVLFFLSNFRRKNAASKTTTHLLDQVTKSLGDDSEMVRRWQEIQSLLARLLDSNVIRQAAKALDLSFDHQNLLLGARILTDLRPIFPDSDESLDLALNGIVVSFVLRLEFQSQQSDPESTSIAMDQDDVRKLKDACERALAKADAAVSYFEAPHAVPCAINGDIQRNRDDER